jgi:competence protein ComFC
MSLRDQYTPRSIIGRWKQGCALDFHTLSSQFLGHDEFGHPRFENNYSNAGKLLHALKYKQDSAVVDDLVGMVEDLMARWKPPVDVLVVVPPSNKRVQQPVFILAEAISKRLLIPLANCVSRTREIPQLKNISDLDDRLKLLEGLHKAERVAIEGKSVLLFDDLFRSGATMNSVTTELYECGATDVFALSVTRTRSNQ